MRRFMIFMAGILLFLCVSVSSAGATEISLTETFLGGDDAYFDVWEDYSATFAFNLTAQGDYATLKDEDGNVVSEVLPNPDAIDFVPGMYKLDDALLDFTFSSSDTLWDETVTIKAGILDGGTLIEEKEYSLGKWTFCHGFERQYADLSIDLLDLGLESALLDGEFVSVVIALDDNCPLTNAWWGTGNDFRIDEASLMVNAHAPEPATLVLFGIGIAGLAISRRKFKK